MNTVTLQKDDYRKIQRQARAYELLIGRLFEFVVKDPLKEVMADFQKTNLYSKHFLTDLEQGLKKSSYFKSKQK